jgi:hypothetical protein
MKIETMEKGAEKWVFETNGHKWSNNDDTAGDNFSSFIAGAKWQQEQAKEMEKNNTDNKVIHFAEWLTKKHTSTLITLYEHFEEEYYNETFKSE